MVQRQAGHSRAKRDYFDNTCRAVDTEFGAIGDELCCIGAIDDGGKPIFARRDDGVLANRSLFEHQPGENRKKGRPQWAGIFGYQNVARLQTEAAGSIGQDPRSPVRLPTAGAKSVQTIFFFRLLRLVIVARNNPLYGLPF